MDKIKEIIGEEGEDVLGTPEDYEDFDDPEENLAEEVEDEI